MRNIECGEWGSPEADRWSAPFAALPEDRRRLEQLSERGVLDVEPCAAGRVRIAGRDHCGRVRLPSGRAIDIASKIPLLSLIQWLAFTETLPELERWESGPTLGPRGRIWEALCAFYVEDLARLTQFQFRVGHARGHSLTTHFRGRLDATRLARSACHLPRLPCVHRTRTRDTLANCVLARALDATQRLTSMEDLPEALRRTLQWLSAQWADIDRSVDDLPLAVAAALSRPPVAYRTALRLARHLLLGSAIEPIFGAGGDLFLIQMSRIWEEGVRRILASWAFGMGLRVGSPAQRKRPWADASSAQEPNRWLTVDALVWGARPLVFDAKYKRDFGNESRSDRFQMAAYCLAFGAAAAILVYPTAEGQPELRRLLQSSLATERSQILSINLPMARGPAACEEAVARVLSVDGRATRLKLALSR